MSPLCSVWPPSGRRRRAARSWPKARHVAVAGESAVIVWDEKAKKQHFIRRAAFDTKVPYFGFLVPTPTMPEVKEAPDELFTLLEDWTKPAVITRKAPRRAKFSRETKSAAEPAPPDAVRVLDEGRVAGFEYKVLKADDAKALEEWLQKKGYATRPELTKWLGPYIKQGWIVTAFQIAKSEPGRNEVSTQAVLMSFDTDRPFFPYSEPADQRTGPSAIRIRLLRVFFVGSQRMQCALEDRKAFPGRTGWANHLGDTRGKVLQGKLEKTGVSLPDKPYLTVFDEIAAPRLGTSDLYFSPSPDQSAVSRPPITRYVEVDEPDMASTWQIGVVVLGGAAVVLAVVLVVLRYLLRRGARSVE